MDNRRETHDRQSNRLPHYDYSQPGAYFVTVVTHERACLFGVVRLSVMGRIVEEAWKAIPGHFTGVSTAEYVVMPNHVHGVVVIKDEKVDAMCDVGAANRMKNDPVVGARHASPLRRPKGVSPRSLGAIVGSYKSVVTKQIHQMEGHENLRVWQRNYYERVIRDEREYEQIVDYIEVNPLNWEMDSEYRK